METWRERDEETGLYYYGARYLDAKTSRWLSTDPALGEYMAGSSGGGGGMYNTVNFHLYHYGANNPIKYIDPDGRQDYLPQAGGNTNRFWRVTTPPAQTAPATPPPVPTAPDPTPATPTPIIENGAAGADIGDRTLMGTNGISDNGPCLAMAYMGIAQTYAGQNLSPEQVTALLANPNVYTEAVGAMGASAVIGAALDMLGIDSSALNIGREAPAEGIEPFATIRGVGTRSDPVSVGHYQEGTNTGGFRWDPLDGAEDIGRQVHEIRQIYITPRENE